jgi:3,4-dihydroxy 2-butanone 4-phosphate synthase
MESVNASIQELINGKPIIIFDKDNENEGDLIFPSEIINEDILIFMLNHCKGVICVTLEEKLIEKLQIPIFKKKGNNITGQTNFVYPIDHINSETGISSKDRKLIIDELLSETPNSDNFVIPGHQQLLKIDPNGLKNRQGHTESSSEIVYMAGYKKSATICEIIDDKGVPMREENIIEFGKKHNIKIVLLSDIYKNFLSTGTCYPNIKLYKNPFFYLNNKTIIITGGSSGIGKSLKEKLLHLSSNIIIDFSRTNGFDITEYDNINKKLNNIGYIDILINCAGYINPQKIENMELNTWNKHIEVNLTSIFNLTKNCIPKFNKEGYILNITSPSSKTIKDSWSAYCCSKSALNSFTLNCSEELKEKNITVNAISPTKTNTPMIEKLFPNIDKKKIIDVDSISNYIINILCDTIENKTTGIIYEITN